MVDRTGTPLVELRDISISFGGIKAVDHVTVDLYPGEVVGLLGHNGAGKSTLIKCLSGAYQADQGEILINGQKVEINNPREARWSAPVGCDCPCGVLQRQDPDHG